MEIAGEISMSNAPGSTMKKWREIFGISQMALSKHMGISPSTISDYESNRRSSPGSKIIKRFVDALFAIDLLRGGAITQKLTQNLTNFDEFFEIFEFASTLSAIDFIKLIGAKPVSCQDLLENKKIYGYTLIDSLRVILEMPYSYFPKLYGSMSDRAFLFTGVATGRSPMVVIRVTPTKPSLVVLSGEVSSKNIDKLAIRISEKERIPIAILEKPIKDVKQILSKL